MKNKNILFVINQILLPNAKFIDKLYYNHTSARAAWIIGKKGNNIRNCVLNTQKHIRGWYRAELDNGQIDLYASSFDGLKIFKEMIGEIIQMSEFCSELD